jgi:DNA repair exonuclease SbcCD ATPase subunit
MGMKDWLMLNVNSKYENDILQYCKVNNIEDVSLFVTQCFKQGFDIKRYGFLGNSLNEGEKHLITEVIVEKRIEIPVEVIKEVIVEREVIKEVPIEVIKEVPVEKVVTKIEYISDKESENELLFKIQQLEETIFHLNDDLESEREEFSTKTQETAKIFQQEMSKKDNSLDELRRNLDEVLDKPPVEIIKEVEVIKEVEQPNDKLKMLSETLMKLRGQLNDKDDEIRQLKGLNKQLEMKLNPTGAVYMKGSNINENI